MDRRREVINRAVTEFLEIPKDLVLDLPKVTLLGRNELYLENHRGIIEFSINRLRINLNRGYLEIEGDNLEIKNLMPDELAVHGEIYSVKYLD